MSECLKPPLSYKVGVKTSGDREFVFNGLRFATREEAESYGKNLFLRWTAVTEWEVHEATEEPNK